MKEEFDHERICFDEITGPHFNAGRFIRSANARTLLCALCCRLNLPPPPGGLVSERGIERI